MAKFQTLAEAVSDNLKDGDTRRLRGLHASDPDRGGA